MKTSQIYTHNTQTNQKQKTEIENEILSCYPKFDITLQN